MPYMPGIPGGYDMFMGYGAPQQPQYQPAPWEYQPFGSTPQDQMLLQMIMQQQMLEQQQAQQQQGGFSELGGALEGGKKIYDALSGGSALATPTSLPALTQVENLMMGAPANAVASAVGPGGEAATLLADGSLGSAVGETGLAQAMPYLGGAGAALGAYGAFQGIKDKNPISAGLGGLGTGLGLNAMGYALGPVGWAAAIGAPVIGALINKMGDKDRWKTEQDRRDKLVDQGIAGWEELSSTMPRLTRGRSKEELQRTDLSPDFVGFDDQGTWVNNVFNMSRYESDLRPEDIWGYSAFGEKFGNDWLGKFNEEQRRQIAQEALNQGIVDERSGSIYLGDSEAFDAKVKEIIGG